MAGANDTSLENLTFKHAPMTFEGSALVIRGSTSFTDSLLTFKGTSLQVNDAAFSGQGIYQAGASPSVATLSNVSITGYTQFGYRLGNGQVTIANGNFVHDQSAAQGPNGPWALRIEAAFDSDSSVTSVATRYDGVAFRPPTCSSPDQTACTVVGPDTCAGVYTISPGIRVSFSQ
jgi:hypothetical protein